MTDELLDFLGCFHFVYPNLNDTFSYATADTEKIAVDWDDDEVPGNATMLVRMWREFGHAGIVAYVGKTRGADPIPPLRTEEYEAAKASLEGWSYDPD